MFSAGLELGGDDAFEYQPMLLSPSFLSRTILQLFSKQVPLKAKVSSIEVQETHPCPLIILYNCLLITANRSALDLHIHGQFFLVCKCDVQQNASLHWLLEPYVCNATR